MTDFNRLDSLYHAYRIYLDRKRNIWKLLENSDEFHDESIDLLDKAYECASDKSASLLAEFLSEIMILNDEGGYDK